MVYAIARLLVLLYVKIIFFFSVSHAENLPRTGGVVICANHRSFWDPVLIAVSSKRRFSYIGKEELFQHTLLAPLLRWLRCYPVSRGGRDISAVKTSVSLLRKGEPLVIFPEGERIKGNKKPQPKAGALRLAIMAGVPVIPVGIYGNFRCFHKMQVRIGKPIDTSIYKGKRFSDEEYDAMIWEVMDKVYALAETEYTHD